MGAKNGTTTDISIYDRKIDDVIYTYAIPITFPDKIQPLIQAINLGQYAILSVTNVDRYLGEQIIALDSLNFTDGFILHSYEVDEEKLRALVRNTSVSRFKLLDSIEQLKQEMTRLEPKGHNDHHRSHVRDRSWSWNSCVRYHKARYSQSTRSAENHAKRKRCRYKVNPNTWRS